MPLLIVIAILFDVIRKMAEALYITIIAERIRFQKSDRPLLA